MLMSKVFTVAQVIAPIFAAILLGSLARRKQLLSAEENRGLQQFVLKFALPCVIFNSCLTADIGTESLGLMAMVLPAVLIATLWAFSSRKKQFPHHNLPMLFCAQETGMLGIPLFMILFGVDQAYRIGILDITQAIIVYPVIGILSANTGENPTFKSIIKSVCTSPLLIMCALGLTLNFSGLRDALQSIGILGIITESTGFLAQPVSAIMIFSVGYNFSLDSGNRSTIFKISAIHFAMFALFGLLIQAGLFLLPNVEPITRWSILMYTTLPASYLAPGMGRSDEDRTVASGVCSILTVACLLVFCGIAIAVA